MAVGVAGKTFSNNPSDNIFWTQRERVPFTAISKVTVPTQNHIISILLLSVITTCPALDQSPYKASPSPNSSNPSSLAPITPKTPQNHDMTYYTLPTVTAMEYYKIMNTQPSSQNWVRETLMGKATSICLQHSLGGPDGGAYGGARKFDGASYAGPFGGVFCGSDGECELFV